MSTNAPPASTIGLSASEAAQRLLRDGPNAQPQPDQRHWPRILLSVLREPMLLLLIAACVLYLSVGEPRDAAALGLSVLLVVGLTLYQEMRAENALQALRDLSSPFAIAWRDGALQRVPATSLVVGDVVQVAEGDRVPADAKLLDSSDLRVDESLLTGESVPVARAAGADDEAARIRAGTLVVRGQAMAEVTATGSGTEMGRIGASLGELNREATPLQHEIRRLVLWFTAASIASCVLVFALYLWLRGGWLDALLAGITLAMATIPEEFPVVLTVFLALGAWRMARLRVLVRRPPAIEALGSVTVLCTDKTGTLTENRMALTRLLTDGATPRTPDDALDGDNLSLLQCAARASDADGFDPMDRAVHAVASARPADFPSDDWEDMKRYPVTPALPAYATAWRCAGRPGLLLACKGAPEAVAALCGLAEEDRTRVLAHAATMAAEGLRVLAVADAQTTTTDAPDSLEDQPFTWRGLLGFADPLRAEVPAAVAEAHAAGVRVVLMTGDHVETARAIAIAAGICDHPQVTLGASLEQLDADALRDLLGRTDVFARVRPEHKLRLVQALRDAGEVVAMTGDGVNDAPALMAAHVGVAMGGRGTDVAREAASIVLLDDDFASVVRAIRMGRTIYANLERAARYIVAVHVPIAGLALLPLVLGTPLILLPLHVVFLEMVIDPACSIVLEREPPAPDLMRRPPRPSGTPLLGLRTIIKSMLLGASAFALVLLVYLAASRTGLPSPQPAALAFAALIACNIALVLWHMAPARGGIARPTNVAFWITVVGALALLACLTLVPAPARWFGFVPVSLPALFVAVVAPALALTATHWIIRRLRKTHATDPALTEPQAPGG
ncbi:MAG: cation-translocating P-type ATPase [Luteimonas sp.]